MQKQNDQIKIFQLYFAKSQLDRLDSKFVPVDTSNFPGNIYEFTCLHELANNRLYEANAYTGVVSYKFTSKTRISGTQFIDFIKNNPGYDCYFINPFPHMPYLSYNMWTQAEIFHPGISIVAEKFLQQLELVDRLSDVGRHASDILCYCNFWVGNSFFWQRFAVILDKIKSLINLQAVDNLFAKTDHIHSAPYFPFIFERVFTSFISMNRELKVLAYPRNFYDIITSCNFSHEVDAIKKYKEQIDCYDKHSEWTDGSKEFMNNLSREVLGETKRIIFKSEAPRELL